MLSTAPDFSQKNVKRSNASHQKAAIVEIVQHPNDNERGKDINYVIHANLNVFFFSEKKKSSETLCRYRVSFKIPQKL